MSTTGTANASTNPAPPALLDDDQETILRFVDRGSVAAINRALIPQIQRLVSGDLLDEDREALTWFSTNQTENYPRTCEAIRRKLDALLP